MKKGYENDERKIYYLSAIFLSCIFLLGLLIVVSIYPGGDSLQLEKFRTPILHGIAMLMLVGMCLLYWYIMPLIRRVLRSERELLVINEQLRESEERFRMAFDYAATGIALVSIQGNCYKANASLCHMLGYEEKELLKLNLPSLLHPEDMQRDLPFIRDMLANHTQMFQAEQRLYHKNSQIIWVLVTVSLVKDANNQPHYFILQMQNITAEKKAKEQLQKMAYHDALTGLANRNRLEEQVKQILATSKRHQVKFALILLDLDHFKNINDTIGHDAGDCLLQIVAERLKCTVRNTDLIARLGGDEFVLVVTDIHRIDEIVVIAQKILANLLQPIVIKNHELYVTTSMGISLYPDNGTDMHMLLKNADLALYRSKENGRNHYQFCTPEMTAHAHEKMTKQQALNQALAREEFEVYYQPKMDLKHQRIVGVEALLRWKNPHFEKIPLNEIISLAEDTGLIVPIGDWVLRTACQQAKSWRDAGFAPLMLSINLSSRQFKQPDFVKNIISIITECHFPPEFLELEITEQLILQDPEATLQVLQDLKKKGMQISIDDFGTGYSSLSYLKSFNVNKIKIDKKFIQGISNNEMDRGIVSALIAMANKLNIKTIAEGVETKEQYEFLLQEDCTEMQGYFLSKPMDAQKTQRFLLDVARKVQVIV